MLVLYAGHSRSFFCFTVNGFDFEANSIMILIIVSSLVYAHHTRGGVRALWLRCKRFDVIRYAKCSAYGTLLRLQTLPFWHGFIFATPLLFCWDRSQPFSGLKEQNPISKTNKSLRDIQRCRYCYCLLACIWFCAEVVSFDTTRVRARFSARSRSFSVLYFCNSYSRDAP